MEPPLANQSPGLSGSISVSVRESLANAGRFWEPRRILYNLVLGSVLAIWLVRTWPHFRDVMTLMSLAQLAVLALLANVCYSAAYLVDVVLQLTAWGGVWRRRRWALWLMGMLLAILVENYWIADEIYPFVQQSKR